MTLRAAACRCCPHARAASALACARMADDFEREERKGLADIKSWSNGVHFTGIENVYFLNALVAVEDKGTVLPAVTASDRGRNAKGEADWARCSARCCTTRSKARAGRAADHPHARVPRTQDARRAVARGPQLAARDQHRLLHLARRRPHRPARADPRRVGNWGVAIILLTFFVKLVLYPLTHKQMASMAKMKELKPEMDRINELYADDREKKGAAVMELYRKKGVNPMAGCFPVLLQLPIWFSLYSSLSSNIRLLNAPFALWWSDLSSPDPYFVLPLALGVLMFVQQKLAPPTGTDPMQAKMMLYMMPTMITSFMLFLPAGLCLYMFTNSALSILQQRFIEARLKANVSATATTSSISAVAQVATHASSANADTD